MTTLRGDVYAMHGNFLNFYVPFSLVLWEEGGLIFIKVEMFDSDLHTLFILIIVEILIKNIL